MLIINLIKAAIADVILTSMWVFSTPLMKILTTITASYLGVQARSFPGLFITTIFASIWIIAFHFIGKGLMNASFNPTTSTTLHFAGFKKPNSSLLFMAVRFPAQAIGGVAGVKSIMLLMPNHYNHLLKGPYLKVDLYTGGIVEGLLTFARGFSVLLVMSRGPKRVIFKVWLVAILNVGLVLIGSGYTGPSMNPASAFGWAYVNNWHNTWKQLYVYWICPFIGAILAAWVFQLLFLYQY